MLRRHRRDEIEEDFASRSGELRRRLEPLPRSADIDDRRALIDRLPGWVMRLPLSR